MKKLLLIATILISSITFGQNFPGERADLLLGKTVKTEELRVTLQRYAYKNFYIKFDTVSKKLNKSKDYDRIFPKGGDRSDYNKLVGKEFKVVKIHEQIQPYSDKNRYYVLELKSDELGTVYYDYDSKYEHNFELEVVGGVEMPEGFYCKDITTKTDKFNGEVRSSSEISEGIKFLKVDRKDGTSTVYMRITEPGKTLNVGIKGVTLLLENGNRIEKPNAEIEVQSVTGANYAYTAFFELTKQDIKLLIENPITDNRLYIYDGTVENGVKFSEYLKCLTK